MVIARLFAKGLSYDSLLKVKFVFKPDGPAWPARAYHGFLSMKPLRVSKSLLGWDSSSA